MALAQWYAVMIAVHTLCTALKTTEKSDFFFFFKVKRGIFLLHGNSAHDGVFGASLRRRIVPR